MKSGTKHSVKNSISRLVFAVLCILLQVSWILVLLLKLNTYSTNISLISSLLALLVVLKIYGQHNNAAFKMPWIIIILALPVLGLSLYLLFGHSYLTRRAARHYKEVDAGLEAWREQNMLIIQEIEQKDYGIANQIRYIRNYGKYPVYKNTDVEFYNEAMAGFKSQLEEIKKAEQFIFMEYFAIEESIAFLELKEILVQKAAEGVEVRVFYDDIGSIGFINKDFVKRMESAGIKCRIFNPILPLINIFMNHRDHRKITVVDGKVGFTGGYNLADEYFNITHPYGHWKDTGVKLTGDGVKSLTNMFLSMWNAMGQTDMDYGKYMQDYDYCAKDSGFVQPYADSPLDAEYVGENVYLNMIKNAKHEIYFTTPYLIISDEMNRELGLAAKRGVDVRIITPGIPDKKTVFHVTRSYYAGLAMNGVRIFEYTPGFMHAKQCVCDREAAVVGTINLDYRSLYLHFENGVYMYQCEAVKDICTDFDEILKVCTEVTGKYQSGRSTALRVEQCLLRLVAPLL